MISPDEVKKLAALARIKLAPGEEAGLSKDMESILGFVEQIREVAGIPSVEKEIVRNVLRDDADSHESGAHTEALLAESPKRGGLPGEALARSGQYVKVKKIL